MNLGLKHQYIVRFVLFINVMLCFFGATLNAQNQDSLFQVYQDTTNNTEVRLNALDHFITSYAYENPDSSLKLSYQLLDLANEIESDSFICMAWNNIGISHGNAVRIDSAVVAFEKMEFYAEKFNLTDLLKNARGNLAICYEYLGEDLKSIRVHKSVLGSVDPEKEARTYVISNIELARLVRDYDYESAIGYGYDAIRYSHGLDDPRLVAKAYQSVSISARQMGKYDLALLYADSALSEAPEKFSVMIADILNAKATIQEEMGELKKAYATAREALKKASKEGSPLNYYATLRLNGRLRMQLGEIKEGIANCMETYEVVKKKKILDEQAYACECLFDGYRKLGKYDSAFHYLETYMKIKSQVDEDRNIRKVSVVETELRLQNKQRTDSLKAATTLAIQVAESDKLRLESKYRMIILVLLSVLFILFLIYAWNRYRKIRLQKEMIQEQKDIIRSEYETLKEFIENSSHELQTPMAIIQSKLESLFEIPHLSESEITSVQAAYIATIRVAELNAALLLLSKIENNQFPLNEKVDIAAVVQMLLDQLSDFIEAKNLTVKLELNNCVIDKTSKFLVDTLVSNLISNAIKHNVQDGDLEIKLNREKLVVENSGSPLQLEPDKLFERFVKSDPKTKGTGLGLSIAQRCCIVNDWKINYSVDNQHSRHRLEVIF